MGQVWNNVYKSDSTFFGNEPSNFALLCFDQMKTSRLTKVLDLGAGHGRGTTFFASNGIEVEALDYSVIFRNKKGTKTKRFEPLFCQK
jgi:2-polyprenyl-3-methyl-5-hydroxy-6-metoxy-1,4-benzoquinol methylase